MALKPAADHSRSGIFPGGSGWRVYRLVMFNVARAAASRFIV
jgi:hypothetical protein